MNRVLKSKTKCFLAVFLAAFAFLAFALSGVGASSARADSSDALAYDQTDVLDDLAEMSIDGVAFSTANYPASESGTVQILAFVEYAYNFYADQQDNYGLYVYVYNPAQVAISAASTLNYIQLRAGGDESANYYKYPLTFLSISEGSGINGLYYKYKFELTETQKETILNNLDSSERIYEIGEIELLTIGYVNATAYEVGNKYTYAGYAAGYGADTSAASTLTCTTAEDTKTISIDVHQTVYRPDGNNGTNVYTQDSLHSVYFAVPNEYITKYGEMTAIHATWRDAVLNPILVTGNSDAAAAIEPYLGVEISHGEHGNSASNYVYSYVSGLSNYTVGDYTFRICDYSWNFFGYSSACDVNPLYMLFEVADADNAYIAPETMLAKMLEMTEKYGGTLINGKYSSCLFESVADEWSEVNVTTSDKTEPITKITVSENGWWKAFFTGEQYSVTSTTTFDGIEAIHEVTENDFSGTDTLNAEALYINENDYGTFKSFYDDATENDETVFLFRYQTSDYIAAEATLYEYHEGLLSGLLTNSYWEAVDTNAYFAKETVNLDFDIIDLTFTSDSVDTVIAVVASPIDAIPGLTPPLITTADLSDFWKYGLALIGGLLVAWLVIKIFYKEN